MTRRFAYLGAQAVAWLHNQCVWRVKQSQCNFLTDSLCVFSRFGSALSVFSLLVVSVCWMPFLFCFCFGSNRFYTRRCFVHLEMYSHCRCVPALRGQYSGTPKHTAVMLVALCCSSGFPLRRGEALRVLGLPHRRSCFLHLTHRMFTDRFLAGSERSVSSSSAAGVDTTSTQSRFSEIVKPACCDVHVCEKAFPRCLRHRREWRWRRRRACCLFSRCMWRSGQRQVHKSVPSLCDVRFTSQGFHVQANSCLTRLWLEWLGGFSDLPSACLPCAGPRYDAARWTGGETQPRAVAPFFFGGVFGRFFDAIPTMLSMRGHAARRSYRRNLGASEARSAQRQPRGLASGT